MSLEEKVRKIVLDILDISLEELRPDANILEDLGADSLDVVEMVMAFEDEFGLEIPEQDAEKIGTLNDIYAYLKEKLPEAA